MLYLSLVYAMLAGHCADCAPVTPRILSSWKTQRTSSVGWSAPSCFHLLETNGLTVARARRTYGEDNILVALVFYSTFEQLDLPSSGSMEGLDVHKYYDSIYEPTPT
jgi:hypothetical protein